MNNDRQSVASGTDTVVLTADDISAEEMPASKPVGVVADRVQDPGASTNEQNFQNN